MNDVNFSELGELLKKSGISITDAAKLFKVSRQSIYAWMNGSPPTQQLLKDTAERLMRTIEKATIAGDLPVVNESDKGLFNTIVLRLQKHVK